MDFEINSVFIDMIIVIFIVLMLIFGYIKGFVSSAYRLVATIISLLIALYLSSPLSALIKIYEVEGIGQSAGNVINRFLLFIIILIVLKVIFALIGKTVIPLIKAIIDKFGILRKIDGILGAIFNLIESLIIVYLALIFIITPVFPKGKQAVQETVIANKVIQLVPIFSQQMGELTDGVNVISDLISNGINNDSYSTASMKSIVVSLASAYNYGLLDQQETADLVSSYFNQVTTIIYVNSDLYQNTVNLLNELHISSDEQNQILSKIVVSE